MERCKKKKYKFALVAAMFLVCIMSAFAVTKSENYETQASVTMDGGTAKLNDTDLNGALRVVNISGVILDMNNSYMYGNSTTGSIGIRIDAALTNITIRGLNNISDGYTYPIRINSATQPNFASVNNGVDNITYSYSSTAEVLTIVCQGSAASSIGISQMNNINNGISGYYDVYHDSTYVESTKSDTYTISSCSTWSFSPTTVNRNTYSTSEKALFFVMAFLIAGGGMLWFAQSGDLNALIPLILGSVLAVYMLAPML